MTHGTAERPTRVRATTQDGKLELSVANAGEPIPSEAMERLFQPFYRLAEQGSQQGLGLGQYIASEIARAHGGRIDLTSSPAETRFTFRMPLQQPDSHGQRGAKKAFRVVLRLTPGEQNRNIVPVSSPRDLRHVRIFFITV